MSCPVPKFPSPNPVVPAPAPDQNAGSNFRIYNGKAQFKANDGLWYDFELVRDQGITTAQPGQEGEE